jgi:hypothetical protein
LTKQSYNTNQFIHAYQEWDAAAIKKRWQKEFYPYKHCRISLLAVLRILEFTTLDVKLRGKNIG